MIKITANGVYTLESDSAGTYHELVASATGSASCKALVRNGNLTLRGSR